MWAHVVVMLSPIFDHGLSLFQSVEDFAVQQFIAQLSVEAFAVAILPRASGLDDRIVRVCAGSLRRWTSNSGEKH
jgi:hypothetical protein